MKIAIGVDLGGTRIKTTAINEEGQILHGIYTPTEDNDKAFWKHAVRNNIAELSTLLNIHDPVIGISAPGIPDAANASIAHMPGRLEGLENFKWSSYLGHSTWVLNDAIAALLAETRFGVAKDKKNAVLLTLGTGVGGAILINGKPYQGSFQKAGHIGHISLDSDGEPDVTGMPGSLEDAMGNCTIFRRSSGRYTDTSDMLQDYRKGDPFASCIWLTSVRKLALAIASLANMLSPECVILGGGITESGDDLFKPLEKFLDIYEWPAGGNRTTILKAQFGDMAGAMGAASFALLQAGA